MIGIKKKIMGPMAGLILLIGITACENELGFSSPQQEERQVTVSLSLGFADEEDGYTPSGTTRSNGMAQDGAFSAEPVPMVHTRADAGMKPDKLYELRIMQYDSNGTLKKSQSFSGATDLNKKLTLTLTALDDCQLVIVACGKDNGSLNFGNSISELQKLTLDKSYFDAIPTDGSTSASGININKMPYLLHLPHVKVTNEGIQSVEGAYDARLLLKRLAAKMTVAWNNNLTDKTYAVKEVRLCQIPAAFRFLPAATQTEWGMTYPSAIVEFIDYFRLTDPGDLAAGSKTLWIPANARGTSAAASSSYYRTKENAPDAASYTEVVVDNSTKNERLYYRAYLGGDASTDFNLLENTDYTWTLNINSTDYRGDGRIQLLDQTPVISTNIVPTSNCLMMLPGTNICFHPYKHEAGTNGWNTYLTDGATLSADKAIDHVRVLWQTKDTGTSGDLVLGYVVDKDNHANLVNTTDIGDLNKALVHVKVPVTKGGNAVIEAVNQSGVTVWSWHIWISDYVPAGLDASKITDGVTREAAINDARNATQGGAVQVYQGISWTDAAGAFYKCVIMDRNLGATKAGMQDNQIDGRRTLGLLYQGGRKDPFFAAADGTTKETKTIFDEAGEPLDVKKQKLTSVEQLIQNPLTYSTGTNNEYPAISYNWNGDGPKTIYDPCPKGWRVPSNGITQSRLSGYNPSIFNDDGTFKYCMWIGFGVNDGTTGALESIKPTFNNIMFYNGSTISSITGAVQEPDFVGSGFIYYGTSEGPDGDKSIFFPAVSLREMNGTYRDKKNNTVYQWTSEHGTKTTSGMLIYQIQDNTIAVTHPIDWKFGFSVRCVQDNIRKKP
jgi:hypothetical protein|nr:DUF4906 domain-containing protein [Bacteroides intestinalis]